LTIFKPITNDLPKNEFVRFAGHGLEMTEANDVGVLGVARRKRRQEGGRLADGALTLVVGQQLERLALSLRDSLKIEDKNFNWNLGLAGYKKLYLFIKRQLVKQTIPKKENKDQNKLW
jgi:hypothetical protein